MALEAYLAERAEANVAEDEKLDSTFADYASYQIRIFLFAGTDTTASMMVYVYHYLSKHPDWRRRLREEHDDLFGPDPNNAAMLLKQSPVLLNQCKLTVAFIKETLRLRAPAGTLRSGLPGVTITDLQGNEQPIDNAGANILHQALHVNPRVWPRPAEFLPERFLVEPGHELYPDPAAFRPFEQGPRNCIGQTLVWNELKIAVILTCRDLEIRDAYDDFDAKVKREMGFGEKCKRKLLGEQLGWGGLRVTQPGDLEIAADLRFHIVAVWGLAKSEKANLIASWLATETFVQRHWEHLTRAVIV
ncbi:hypothetical protein LQW54_009451 [Pestalotiopsis sp. IQ-011]